MASGSGALLGAPMTYCASASTRTDRRGRRRLLVAAPQQRDRPGVVRALGRIRGEGRLAWPASPLMRTTWRPQLAAARLYASSCRASSSVCRPMIPGAGPASRQPGAGSRRTRLRLLVPQRLQPTSSVSTGSARPLSSSGRSCRTRAWRAARQDLDDAGEQDLAPVGPGTQAGGLDDRVPEVVAVLHGGLAGTDADPEPWASPGPGVGLGGLLHRHGAREGRRGRRERHMRPFPRFLTSVPPERAIALRKGQEVEPTHLVRRPGAAEAKRLVHDHQVAEQDRRALYGSHGPPPTGTPVPTCRHPCVRRHAELHAFWTLFVTICRGFDRVQRWFRARSRQPWARGGRPPRDPRCPRRRSPVSAAYDARASA